MGSAYHEAHRNHSIDKKVFDPIGKDIVPSENPQGPFDESRAHEARTHFVFCIKKGLKKAGIKPVNDSKLDQIYQE